MSEELESNDIDVVEPIDWSVVQEVPVLTFPYRLDDGSYIDIPLPPLDCFKVPPGQTIH